MSFVTTELTSVVLTQTRVMTVTTGRAPGLHGTIVLMMAGSETFRAGLSSEAALLLVTELSTDLTGLGIATVGRVTLLAAALAGLKLEATLDAVTGLATLITDRDTTLLCRMTLLPTTRT